MSTSSKIQAPLLIPPKGDTDRPVPVTYGRSYVNLLPLELNIRFFGGCELTSIEEFAFPPGINFATVRFRRGLGAMLTGKIIPISGTALKLQTKASN
jgi:hypothetical protein